MLNLQKQGSQETSGIYMYMYTHIYIYIYIHISVYIYVYILLLFRVNALFGWDLPRAFPLVYKTSERQYKGPPFQIAQQTFTLRP